MTKRERATLNALTRKRALCAASTALVVAGLLATPSAAYAATTANLPSDTTSLTAKTAQATLESTLNDPIEAPESFTTSDIESFMKSITPVLNPLYVEGASNKSTSTSGTAASEGEAMPKGTRTLSFDYAIVDEVGTQVSTGHTSCCLAFSQAYGESFATGNIVDHTEYAMYGSCAYNPCASYGPWTDWRDDLGDVCRAIDNGKPAVVHVMGFSGYEHWVLAIGYENALDFNEVTLDNLVVVDPWDGETLIASDRFTRYDDGQIRLME